MSCVEYKYTQYKPSDRDDKSNRFHSFHFQLKVTELRIDLIFVNEQTKNQRENYN